MDVVQRLGERFWVVPAALCLAAAALAEALVALDDATDELPVPAWLGAVLYRVGESGSRDILGAIASSTLAVAGTTFSITIAVMALTSSSYGPRLVRGFLADRGNQVVLGVFVATFLYCLLVLRSIRVLGEAGGDPFVPHLAVNTAVLLALVDIGVLVYFIHHISDSIQVATLARGVRGDLCAAVDRLFPDGDDERPAVGADRPPPVDGGAPVTARDVGYVRRVGEERLERLASRHDVLLDVRVLPGRYVVPGTALAVVHPADRCSRALERGVEAAFDVGTDRSPLADLDFTVQQLTEMAVRALSPGTNDPYTAVNALDELSTGLVRLVSRRADLVVRDRDGRPRVLVRRPDPVAVVRSVLDSVRWYAADAPLVMHHCLEVVERVGAAATVDGVRQELVQQVGLLRTAFERAGHLEHDVREFGRHAREVEGSLLASAAGT